MDAFNWCFIGTGTLAAIVARQLLGSGRHRIVSCYSRSASDRARFANEFGALDCASAGDAITAEGVDAVYVVTPHNAHYRYVKLALELGRPVLCEKAFTVTAAEAEELIDLARSKGIYLCEAMWTWFSEGTLKAREWVGEGRIGRIRSARFTFHARAVGYAPRVSDPKKAGGALLDITVYPITYAYRLWGMPVRIESTARLENGIDAADDIALTFSNGLRAQISTSIVDVNGFEIMLLKGDKGRITAPFYHSVSFLTCRTDHGGGEVFRSRDIVNTYLEEFDIVADEIRRGLTESEYVPLHSTLDVMRIMDTVREQIGLKYDDLE